MESAPSDTAYLAAAELAEASRFGSPDLVRRFVARRCALRRVLAEQLGVSASELEIVRDGRAKPRLRGRELDFSAASSGELALIAVSHRLAVGVDLERIDGSFDYRPLVEAHFAEDATPATREDFFAAWTRKEAIAKALGIGLAAELRTIDSTPGVTVYKLPVPSGYASALALVEGLPSTHFR